MLYLRTGLPGTGKTLFTLADVKAWADKDSRPVYYSGIKDLRVPGWIEFDDPAKWPDLVRDKDGNPTKAIIVIDEAQRSFRPRHSSSAVPEHVSRLETHRHEGVDLVLITQHPKLLDSNVRRLVGLHKHYVRMFGSQAANEHAWEECNPDPDASRADSISTVRTYPKEVYGWYHSAEVHTHKRRIPARLVLLLLTPLLLAGVAGGVYWWVNRKVDSDASRATVAKIAGQPGKPAADGAPGAADSRGAARLSTAEWLAVQQPRVPGLAFTAPVYDSVTQPKSAPFPAACMSMGTRCSCYTRQGTILDTPEALCRDLVAKGMFEPWRDEAGTRPMEIGAAQPQAAPRQDALGRVPSPGG